MELADDTNRILIRNSEQKECHWCHLADTNLEIALFDHDIMKRKYNSDTFRRKLTDGVRSIFERSRASGISKAR